MPRNKTLSELWPSCKDPAFSGRIKRQDMEESMDRRRAGYSLRERRTIVDYREDEETSDDDVEEVATATDEKNATTTKSVECPVCWSSLTEEELEVFTMGCGHLVCGLCLEEVVVGGRGCPVCRNKEAVLNMRRIFF